MRKLIIPALIASLFIAGNEKEESFTDHDGNTYHTTIVGSYEVMCDNYAATHFLNGDPIEKISDEEEWKEAAAQGRPAYCEIQGPDDQEEANGYLYNWYVTADPRGFVPEGWKVPTEAEFTEMLGEGISNKSDSYLCGYRVQKESRKKIEKLIRKGEMSDYYPNNRLLFHASGMRLGDGRYNTYAKYNCYVMLAEYKQVYRLNYLCAKLETLDNNEGSAGFPIRLIRKVK